MRPDARRPPGSSPDALADGGSAGHRAGPRWKLAVLTGLAACVAAIAVLTLPELIAGHAISSNDHTTIFGGGSARHQPTRTGTSTTTSSHTTQSTSTKSTPATTSSPSGTGQSGGTSSTPAPAGGTSTPQGSSTTSAPAPSSTPSVPGTGTTKP